MEKIYSSPMRRMKLQCRILLEHYVNTVKQFTHKYSINKFTSIFRPDDMLQN